ncbi:hypothetical protein VSAK1_21714 [Vibrio mediterranei AK1]|uniref:hypothetical protein n=1 Tax=Vibrio TaxID=662 RepID=UPI00015413D0|nr:MULTISPECIES: hypothetical protein [Vibrio]EDL54161.1 hypothetical protein VSAK1_21714 [Vibrio mediterranei AK1]MCF4176571.1 hypothetical protein [Vibrio sp. McD22-P3]
MKNYILVFGSLVSSSLVYGLEIESVTRGDEFTTVGFPIIASDNSDLIYHYKEDGSVNDYVWMVDDKIISKGVAYTPSESDTNKDIKLCLIEKGDFNCSNTLKIITKFGNNDAQLRNSRAPNTDINDYWEVNNTITNEEIINDEDTSVKIKLSVDYIGAASIDELPSGSPYVTDLFYTLKSDTTVLQSTSRLPGFTHNTSNQSTSYNTTISQLNLSSVPLVSLCTFGLSSHGASPTIEPSSCSTRLVTERPENLGNWVQPPTKEQFTLLFPGQSYLQETVGSKTYVASPRLTNTGINLVESYCKYISPRATPPTSSELKSLAQNTSIFDDSWPGMTNYWTNTTTTNGPFTFAGITWAETVSISGTNTTQIAPSEVYNGYLSCIVKDESK